MITWEDEAIVLGRRVYAERHALVHVFTKERGRWAGLVRGGAQRTCARREGLCTPGSCVHAAWKARLAEQLGTFHMETVASPLFWETPLLTLVTQLMCALLMYCPQHYSYPLIFDATHRMLYRDTRISPVFFMMLYVTWELALLASLGFALSLERCAVTHSQEDLAYVSPKTGCAVTRGVGMPYHNKLLPLPMFLRPQNQRCLLCGNVASLQEETRPPSEDVHDLRDGLALSGYFLKKCVLQEKPTRGVADLRQTFIAVSLKKCATP